MRDLEAQLRLPLRQALRGELRRIAQWLYIILHGRAEL